MCVRRAVREGFEKTSVLSVCVFCFVCFHTAKIQNNRAKCKYLVVFFVFCSYYLIFTSHLVNAFYFFFYYYFLSFFAFL